MRKFFSFLGSLALWAGVLLSIVSLQTGLSIASAAGEAAPWLHGILMIAAAAPLSIIGAWLAARQATDSPWTRCAVGLHGMALAPLLFFTLLLGELSARVAGALPMMLGRALPFEGLWLVLGILGPAAAFLGWCVAGIRLRRWRRQRLAGLDPDAGLGWPWAAGLTAGIVALGTTLFLLLLSGDPLARAME